MTTSLAASLYLISGALFILALRGLSSPETSRRGNFFGVLGMTLAIIVTFLFVDILFSSLLFIICALAIGGSIGAIISYRISMTAMPQLVAGFHSLVGLAAVLVALSVFYNPEAFGLGTLNNIKTASLVEMSIGASIGAITFTGSVIAFLKLQGLMSGRPITFKGQHFINLLIGIGIVSLIIYVTINQSNHIFWTLIISSFFIGVLLIIPIGGADMPVVISMLNSYSGWAAAGIGFTLENTALIITGALVGSSGAILSYIMCKGMNRSFFNVILGGFGGTDSTLQKNKDRKPVKSGNAEDAAFLMKNASSVIIVPGYGMAVAQAQHVLREMADNLKKKGLKDCDIVMMLRLQNERMTSSFLSSNREYYEYYGLTPDKLSYAKDDALIMHPGPMNRGIEIDTNLADDINRSVIREQVELGVAVRMACLKIFCK